MNEQLENFLKALEAGLRDIPQDERNKAIEYYREYLYDACESGADPDTVITQVGDAETIASAIRMEASIARARSNPGIRNYGNALKNTFRMVTAPFSILTLVLLVLLSGSIVTAFFTATLCTFAVSVGVLFIAVYEATRMSGQFFMEIAGTVGIGLMLSGLSMLLTLCLYRLGRVFIRISVWLIGKIKRKPVQYQSDAKIEDTGKRSPSKRFVWCFTAMTVAGLVLFSVSGLPVQFFNIFNSTKPNNIQMEAFDYKTGDVNAVSIVSAHSIVRIKRGSGNDIRLLYEKSDWLDDDVKTDGKTLYFYEKSNGRLPLFNLVTYHESLTELQLEIPAGYNPDMIKIDSTGGHIIISGIDSNLQAETMNGRIEFDRSEAENTRFIAKTVTGSIYSGDRPVGQKTGKGTEYISIGESGRSIELFTRNGDIYIQ